MSHGYRQLYIAYIKAEDIYIDTAKYFKTRFDTSNHQLERPLPKGKNKKVFELIKNKSGRKIFTASRAKNVAI